MAHKRYSTYLRKAKSDRQPSRMGALAVVSSPIAGGGDGSRRTRQLERWGMEMWACRHGRAGHIEYVGGTTSAHWLSALGSVLATPGRRVVLCPRALQALTLLGAWDMVDAGRLLLERVPLLVSDPPTAIGLRVPGRPGRLLILDTANYGVKISDGPEACAQTGEFTRSMVSALVYYGMGTLQITAGAQALYGFRHCYLSHYLSTHTRHEVIALERASTHGGRAECYRLGRVEGPIYYLDYTGFYASIMRDIDVPVRLRHWGTGWTEPLMMALAVGHGVIARVRLLAEEPRWPCVREGLTVWPVGEWWTVLAGGELDDALSARAVVDIADWATYDMEPALSAYALACLAIRREATAEGNTHLSRWSKALAVTLVGKFAARVRCWEDRPRADVVHRWGAWPYRDVEGQWWHYRALGGVVQREVIGGETSTSCPAVTAWIYAEGRRRLWAAQAAAGRENVYYSNTDSLFVNKAGFDRLCAAGMVAQGELGMLSLKATWPWIEILGISHYRVPGRTVCAGVVGSGGGESVLSPAGWVAQSAHASVVEGHAPLPVEIRTSGERHWPYRHGVRGEGGIVHPWRV